MGDAEGAPDAIPIDCTTAAESSPAPAAKVPINLITGFLGAGKSTLVKHILSQPHGYKIAVILNDFGDNLGIERALVKDVSSAASSGANQTAGSPEPVVEEWVEVGNGCICCSVKHSFVLALEQLLERRDKFDYILLETTGLANPGPIISMLWTDDELESPLRLDSVVTVVDGRNILGQLEEDPLHSGTKLAQLQIAFADVVILNKMDLLKDNPLAVGKIKCHISSINASARILLTERSAVETRDLLNQSFFYDKDLSSLREPQDLSSHLQLDIKSFHFSCPGEVDLKKLEAWLTDTLWEPKEGMSILRMKGAVCVHRDSSLKIFQAVRELFEIVDGRQGSRTRDSVNRVLVVGSNLNESSLQESFTECLVQN